MTAGAHDTGEGFGRSAGVNAARGVAVIVGAVLLGVFLMVRGVDDNATAATETTPSTVDEGVAEPTDTAAEEDVVTTLAPEDAAPVDDTLGAQRNPSEVTTLAVNGTDPIQSGVASRTSDRLTAEGYAAASPANADTPGPSAVLFMDGYESDARAIAQLFGVDPDAVVRPFDAATSPVADTRGANVIVVAGSDGVITP